MEEISWGQQFIKFETPKEFMRINAQNELTLHNINYFQGKSEIFRIFFGIMALFGLYLQKWKYFSMVSVPFILFQFVLVILIISILDLSDDYYPISREIQNGTHLLSELIEMLIGLFSLLYLIFLKIKIENHYYLKFKMQENKINNCT